MASSVSRQDVLNPALWLATEWARWCYLVRSGLPCVFCKKMALFSHLINPLLTELVLSRWLVSFFFFFCMLMTLTLSWSVNTQKELGQYPAILTSCLVNNPYISITQYYPLFSEREWHSTWNSVFVYASIGNKSTCSLRKWHYWTFNINFNSFSLASGLNSLITLVLQIAVVKLSLRKRKIIIVKRGKEKEMFPRCSRI